MSRQTLMNARGRRRATVLLIAVAVLLALPAVAAEPAQDAALVATLTQRLHGDRTGACIAAAVLDKTAVRRAYVCADGKNDGRIGPRTGFEIGSVSKTMTATLLAEMIDAGNASLDDPLAAWLPKGSTVPSWHGQPIRLHDIVTHSSGLPALPPGVAITNPADPYAGMAPQAVIDALGKVRLAGAPGSQPQYSNFAMMLLSAGLAQRAGTGFEALLQKRLFQPLGMRGAWVAKAPAGYHEATGHRPGGQPVSAWRFPSNMAGVGGVRATLDAMVRYTRAQLEPAPTTPVGKAIALTHQEVAVKDPLARGMNWFISERGEHKIYWHEGGTGGFSALVMFEPARQRGVVLLCDTNWTNLGGLGRLGAHLLDAAQPLPGPRQATPAPAAVLDGLAGRYELAGGMGMVLSHENGALYMQADGQPRFRMGHDSAGDFYPEAFDALLHPVQAADGSWSFSWHQGGGVVAAHRLPAKGTSAADSKQSISSEQLAAYAGSYPLMPGFVLQVDQADGRLRARATGQSAFSLDYLGKDSFAAPAFGIRLEFKRDAQGKVIALDLHQAGHVLHGQRQMP